MVPNVFTPFIWSYHLPYIDDSWVWTGHARAKYKRRIWWGVFVVVQSSYDLLQGDTKFIYNHTEYYQENKAVFHFTLCMFVCMPVCINNNLLYIHLVGDDMLITSSMWCLGLLLIPIKMRPSDSDIPFLSNLIMQNIMINICRIQHLHQSSRTRIATNPMWLCLKGISTINTLFQF